MMIVLPTTRARSAALGDILPLLRCPETGVRTSSTKQSDRCSTPRPPSWRGSGLSPRHWTTHGFLGFCPLMNSDVLVFNRLFRFLPGIRAMARLAAGIDAACLKLPFLRHAGLQVVGAACKLSG